MLLGGLWHGASWTFVAWGALHGALLMAQRLLEQLSARFGLFESAWLERTRSLLALPLTFLLICFTWVFFRAPGFEQAWQICGAMLGLAEPQGGVAPIRLYETVIVAVAAIVVFVEPVLFKTAAAQGIGWWWRMPFPLRGSCYAALVLTLVVLGGPTQKFIYFDF
jgi:D-alanyl-lipoteichoic acid acyltransferase DltB (MBOAT superfamily)